MVVAKLLGGDVWQSDGDIWLVVIRRNDGRVIAVSDEVTCEYADDDALEPGKPLTSSILV